jgi:hypothetical protein
MQKKIKFIFFVIISLFLSITVFAQETKVLEGIKDKITIQPNANSQSGSLTYKDKIGDTSIYVTPQYDKFGGISSNAGLNYSKKFGDSSLFVTPVYNQFGQVSGTAGGTYYEKFGDSLLVVTPQYSKLTGLSTTGSFAIPLTDNFAAGLLLTAGTDKSEIFINSGFRIDDKQRVIFSLGQLRQNLDYNFLSGTENTQVTQNNVGLSYHYFLDKYWVNTVEANGYFSKTQSQNLTDKNYYTDTSSLYELWSDPRRIAGGTVEGFQGRLIFLPTEKTILKVGVGGERLNYDVQTGKDTSNYVTANTEINQKIKPNLDLRASVDYTAAENRYAIGLTHNLGTDRKLSLDARAIRGSTFDDKQIFLSYTQAFGKRDQADDKKEIKTTSVVDSNQIRADIINNVRPLTSGLQTDQFQNKDNKKDFLSTLLNEVAKRPNYFPAQTIAKVDTSAASTRVIKIDKTNIPDGSSVNKSSGILTIPIGTSVSSIAGITKNGAAFINTGQFTLSGNTNLIVDPSLLGQPTTQDTYVVTMNNTTGGGTTLATIKVDRGSTFISSVVISSGSIAPTLSGLSLSSSSIVFGAAAPTITAPTSESAGAITYTSSNTNVATISGSTITIVGVGVTTITATQAANGNYSSATTTTSLTVTASTVATLSNLTIASGTLSPVFASNEISYSASVSNGTTSVTVTPTVTNSNSTLKVNGVTITSGVASGAISLNEGANTITTVVTAQDATTTKTYTIIVTRAGAAVSVNYLIVAGGGGGGYRVGGGGGAGGLLASTTSLSSGVTYTIQVGSGGSKGSPGVINGQGGNGGDSYISGTGFTTITAIGGGGGGSNETTDGSSRSGGSSGGRSDPRGGMGVAAATAGQGNKGGESEPGWGGQYGTGGGGGAGAVGSNYNADGGGAGGVGLASDITGTSVYYAGGGGGGSFGTGGLGGNGGGGNSTGVSATANATDFTGGGGGGSKNNGNNAGAGGKGVVILSIPTANYSGTSTGSPTITTSGSNTILKFTGNGTYTQ